KMAEERILSFTSQWTSCKTPTSSAFTVSADVPLIYIQQFWNTFTMDTKSGVYSFQLDELWFTLDADLLRNALGITPKDSAYPFLAPPAGDLSWRTILSMINQCLTGKTSGSDRPRYLVLQILWGVVSGTNIDYAELIWEERNIHKRPQSPLHITADDYLLGNLKFVLKGELDEKKAPPVGKSKQPIRAKQSALTKQTKPVKEKTSKPSPSKKIGKGKVMKVRKGKRSDHLVDKEDEEDQPASEPQVEDDEYNLQRGIQMSLEYFQALVGGVAIHEL
ncbi:hypothetical protein Tco_1200009, partial [Tanacetum coccineum]